MIRFEDERASLAQSFHLAFDSIVQHTDQRTDHEDTAKCHE